MTADSNSGFEAALQAVIPASAGCCGLAGDRGFLVPELTESATAIEADEIRARDFDGFYPSSRTCEIGMTRATSMPYRSFWYLLEEASLDQSHQKHRPTE